jgi:hypothetical protein
MEHDPSLQRCSFGRVGCVFCIYSDVMVVGVGIISQTCNNTWSDISSSFGVIQFGLVTDP